MNFTAVAPRSLKNYSLEQAFADGKVEYPFLLEEVEEDMPDLDAIPMHFSYKRGIPILNEYEIDKKIAYVFNLPDDLNTR